MHEQAAIVAVPDSNGIASGCRNPIALWIRLDRLPVAECLYSFAGFNNGCCPIVRCRRETIGDIVEILCDKTFWYVFASHTNTSPQPVLAAIQWPSSDTATVDKLHLRLSLATLESPLHRQSRDSHSSRTSLQIPRPTLVIAGFNDQHQCALHLVSTHSSLSTTRSSNDTTQSSSAMAGVDLDEQAVVLRTFVTLTFKCGPMRILHHPMFQLLGAQTTDSSFLHQCTASQKPKQRGQHVVTRFMRPSSVNCIISAR